jgi:predicted double-glycine peptidase
MKKMMAVLLAVLIIGTTPAFAIPHGETADVMAVKGKGADVAAASELVEAVESRQATETGNETLNVANNSTTETITSDTSTEQIIIGDPVPADDQATGANVQVPDLNDSLENDTVAIPQIDTSGIVMQSSDFSCGPAALATVLNNLGVHATEQELIVLAGTDTSGTTMHGLSEAAKVKGVNAVGMRLSVDDLRPNNIVHIILDGEGHYSVIREITESGVKLADPSLGNIEMTREKFSAIFTGNVLVISDPNMQVNQTETTNQTNSTSVQSENQSLTNEEMQTIEGRVIKVLAAAFVAAIKIAAKKAVSIAKREVGRVGKRAAIRKARQWAERALDVWRNVIPRPVRGAIGGLTSYLDGNPWYQWCSWRATRSMIIGAIFAL